MEKQFKVIVTEQQQGYEETYQFDTKTILTKEEYQGLLTARHEGDEKKISEIVIKVVETRLKIKTVTEELQLVKQGGGSSEKVTLRYVAYFVDISTLIVGGQEGAVVAAATSNRHEH